MSYYEQDQTCAVRQAVQHQGFWSLGQFLVAAIGLSLFLSSGISRVNANAGKADKESQNSFLVT